MRISSGEETSHGALGSVCVICVGQCSTLISIGCHGGVTSLTPILLDAACIAVASGLREPTKAGLKARLDLYRAVYLKLKNIYVINKIASTRNFKFLIFIKNAYSFNFFDITVKRGLYMSV